MGIDIAQIQRPFANGDVKKLNVCTPQIGSLILALFLESSAIAKTQLGVWAVCSTPRPRNAWRILAS